TEHQRQVAAQVARLELMIKEEEAEISAARAAAVYGDRELARKLALVGSGTATEQAVEKARNDAERAHADAARHAHVAERYRLDMEAVRGGVLLADQQFDTQQLRLRIE